MKKKIYQIVFYFVLTTSYLYAQAGSSSVNPSVYYTRGNYSNGNTSDSYSAYASIQLGYSDFIFLGTDNLLINNPAWKYDQKTIVIGGIKNLYPLYLKLNYAHIKGEFDYKPFPYKYSDYINLYNAGFLYNVDLFYLGASVTYLNLIGFKAVESQQYELNIGWVISPGLSLFLKPNFSSVSDNRKLYSAGAKLTYLPVSSLIISLGGFIGSRAYYFNSDLLTIYNQNDTQKMGGDIRAEYWISEKLKVIGSYQYLKFDQFRINYFVGGIYLAFPF